MASTNESNMSDLPSHSGLFTDTYLPLHGLLTPWQPSTALIGVALATVPGHEMTLYMYKYPM